MREEIGRLLGWTTEEDGYHHFCFVDDLYDHGYTQLHDGRFCGACLSEVRGITPDDYAWWLSAEGLAHHFEGRDETQDMTEAQVIAYGREQVAAYIAEYGEPCERFFDTPLPECIAQLRDLGFGPEQYVCFDTPGTWMDSLELDHVCDEALLTRVREMEALRGTVACPTP